MVAAAAGDAEAAFDTWMGGVGPDYKLVLEASLGPNGYGYAVTQSRFFFADELPAVREWALDGDRAATIVQPVLLIQGANSPANFHDMINLLAGILTDAEIATLAGVGHLMPLQDPDGVGKLVADFVRRQTHQTGKDAMRFQDSVRAEVS